MCTSKLSCQGSCFKTPKLVQICQACKGIHKVNHVLEQICMCLHVVLNWALTVVKKPLKWCIYKVCPDSLHI